MKYLIIVVTVLFFISCKGKKEKVPESDGFTTDSNLVFKPHKPMDDGSGTAFGHVDSLFIKDPVLAEAEVKRTLMYMAIDSTYAAIKEIEDIKNEIAVQKVGLSLTDRNVKGKALMQLNKIGNALTRQIDSEILKNLKQQTVELALINENLDKKAEHLQELSEKIARAGKVMERITDLLTVCVSKGIVKPTTPPGKLPEQVKSKLN